MVPKFLFIFGIVVAHGAVAASLIHDQPSPDRAIAVSCANTPGADPYFAPPRELLAMTFLPATWETPRP
jgi:hypothetical protein